MLLLEIGKGRKRAKRRWRFQFNRWDIRGSMRLIPNLPFPTDDLLLLIMTINAVAWTFCAEAFECYIGGSCLRTGCGQEWLNS